jgi:hypothetical protein
MMKRLEQVIAEEVIDLSDDLLEKLNYQLGGYHYETQILVDLWVGPAARALKPYMGNTYEQVKSLLVDCTKKAWSTYRFCGKETRFPLYAIRSQVSKNLKEVIQIAEKDFYMRSNILVLSRPVVRKEG